MRHQSGSEIIIALGMNRQERQKIQALLGDEPRLHSCQLGEVSPPRQIEQEEPLLAIIPWRVWKKLPTSSHPFTFQSAEHMVVLDPSGQSGASRSSEFFAHCVLAVLPPETKEPEVKKALDQARECRDAGSQLQHMSREIELDRELLARKNTQLSFLNTLMHHANQNLQLEHILKQAALDLELIVSLQALSTVFWFPDRNGARTQPLLYLPDNLDAPQHRDMIASLLAEAEAREPGLPLGSSVQSYPAPKATAPGAIDPESRLTFPLCMGNDCFGLLALHLENPAGIGRDTSSTLSLAANHLGLVLHNALRLEQATVEADHDGLTGLNNRQHFDRRLQEEWQRHQRLGQPFSLLMLDLDHFKDLNDAYGHLAGDRALAAVGRLLSASLRQSDFPARYGGEEFVIILPHTDGSQARRLAERLRQALAEEPIADRGGSAVRLTASFGVATSAPGQTGTPEELLHLADQALYRAKANGRNQVACASCAAH